MEVAPRFDYMFILVSNPDNRAYIVATMNPKIFDNLKLALFATPKLYERMRVKSKTEIKIEVLETVRGITSHDANIRRRGWYRRLEDRYDIFNADVGR